VYTHGEILVHTEDTRLQAPAELFTAPNRGWTVQDLINKSLVLGHKLIINVDWHFGNGRDEDGGSATGKGKYHYGSAEGGVVAAVRKVLKWDIPNLVAIQIGNEPPKGIAKWYAETCATVKAVLNNEAKGRVKLVAGSSEEMCEAAAPYADVLDPHVIFKTPTQRNIIMSKTLWYGLPVWVTESTENPGVLIDMGANMESAFAGNNFDFLSDEFTAWNGKKYKPPFQCNNNSGLTRKGEVVTEYWKEGGEPPIGNGDDNPEASIIASASWIRGKARRRSGKLLRKFESSRIQAQCDNIIEKAGGGDPAARG
jgi:hypothetical protein